MHSLPKPAEVRVLLPLYGAGERTDSFLELVEAARRGKDWWRTSPGCPRALICIWVWSSGQ